MTAGQEITTAIGKVLKFSQRGLTVTDISKKIRHNRNLTAKQLEILRAEGKVDVRKIGSARVFSLSQRVPLSAFLCFTRNMILILDRNLTVVQANDQYLGLADLTKEELVGRNIVGGTFPIVSSPETLGILRSTGMEQVITDIRFVKGRDEFFYKMEVIPTTFEAGDTGLTVVLEDITEKRRHLRNMEFLARTAMELVDLPPDSDIYLYIAERLKELLTDFPQFYIHSYDEVKREFFMRALEGEAVRRGAATMAGYDLVGMKFPVEDSFYAAPFFESAATFKNMREMHFRPLYAEEEISFYDSCAHIFTEEVCDTFLRTFNIGKIYLTGLVWQDRLFGLVGIFHGPGETLENKQAIESFLRQASIAIARRMTEERLFRSEKRFTDLITLMDLPAFAIEQGGRISLVNPGFTDTFGYSEEDIPTLETWFEKAFPDPVYRKEAVAESNPDGRKRGNPPNGTFEIRCRNGEVKHVVIRPLLFSDGTQVVRFDVKDGH